MLRRIIAVVIDYFIIGLLVAYSDMQMRSLLEIAGVRYLFLPTALFIIILLLCKDMIFVNAGIGKRIMGLAILDENDNVPSVKTMLRRTAIIGLFGDFLIRYNYWKDHSFTEWELEHLHTKVVKWDSGENRDKKQRSIDLCKLIATIIFILYFVNLIFYGKGSFIRELMGGTSFMSFYKFAETSSSSAILCIGAYLMPVVVSVMIVSFSVLQRYKKYLPFIIVMCLDIILTVLIAALSKNITLFVITGCVLRIVFIAVLCVFLRRNCKKKKEN